jgi:hypothetical protein
MTTYIYTAKTKPNSNAFFGIRNLDADAVIEFDGFDDDDGNVERYEIQSSVRLDRFLDQQEGVISYKIVGVTK